MTLSKSQRDLAERVVWTAVAAALTAVVSVGAYDIETAKAAGTAALNAVVTLVLVVARQRLSILPDPGAGLPKLPT